MSTIGHILNTEFQKRATRYLTFLKYWKVKGRLNFAPSEMAIALSIKKDVVLKDLHLLGVFNITEEQPISNVINVLETYLEVKRYSEVFLICTRTHGKAIITSKALTEQGIRVVAAFDPSSNYEPYEIEGVKVLGCDRINSLAERMHITLMVIATNREMSQTAASAAIKAGAKAILNTTEIDLKLPDEVLCIKSTDVSQLSGGIKRIKELLDKQKR